MFWLIMQFFKKSPGAGDYENKLFKLRNCRGVDIHGDEVERHGE